jgi:hypothetical protein
MSRPFRRGAFARIAVIAGAPIAPGQVTPPRLRAEVERLLADNPAHPLPSAS